MALPPNYPDFSDEDVALGIVRRYVKKATDDQLLEQLYERQVQDEAEKWWYRPYAVAYFALKANPRWLIKGKGAEWRDLSHALEALVASQASQDARLDLIVPKDQVLGSSDTTSIPRTQSVPTTISF